MGGIKCPNCSKVYTLPDTQLDALLSLLPTWYCEKCGQTSPTKAWSCGLMEKRPKGQQDIAPIVPNGKPDTRTVEEKQRDWTDDNLRGMFT